MKIGLMLPLADDETNGFADLRALGIAAEEGGLDSVWGADHVIFREGGETTGIHECWTVLTAIAAVTSRVEIGPLVLALPFRNPALTAKMAAELDEVSGGRLILGLGCGWHKPEFDAFGYPFDHRVSRFDEGLQVRCSCCARVAWTSPASITGPSTPSFAHARSARAARRILVAGKQPRMLKLVARYADRDRNGAWYGHPDDAHELRERLSNLRAALDAEGRDPATLELTAGIFVAFDVIGADADAPERAIRGSVDEVADALAGYAALGVNHLIAHVFPRTPGAVRSLGEAAARARQRVPVASLG